MRISVLFSPDFHYTLLWLPIKFCNDYRLLLLTIEVPNALTPQYPSGLLVFDDLPHQIWLKKSYRLFVVTMNRLWQEAELSLTKDCNCRTAFQLVFSTKYLGLSWKDCLVKPFIHCFLADLKHLISIECIREVGCLDAAPMHASLVDNRVPGHFMSLGTLLLCCHI